MLKIFNTMTKKKEIFKPIQIGQVNMYVCGVTVHDLCHLGHGRTFVIFDIIVRFMKFCGYKVNYIRNITDIEDKIIDRANKSNESIEQLTNRMIMEMNDDFSLLDIMRPNFEPKASHYVEETIELIKLLINKKHAYVSSNGDVMFSINSHKNYGILSKQKINNLQVRLPNKHHNLDFVLWKKSQKTNEPSWISPWGYGRPGWHIECSAISKTYVGNNLDIHGGGSDLIFPHHENEIAQSVSADGSYYVNFWIHTGMVTINNKKMSKTLGNFITIREVLITYHPEVLRLFFISTHYRNSLNYSLFSLDKAKRSLDRLYLTLRYIDYSGIFDPQCHWFQKFKDAMDEDFNTPEACSILFKMSNEINRLKKKNLHIAQKIAATLHYLGNILGILKQNHHSYFKYTISKEKKLNIKKIEMLITERDIARQNNKLKLADKIRNYLFHKGIILEDHINQTTWRWV